MTFIHGRLVTRLRPRMLPDPYSGELTRVDWVGADRLQIPHCWLAPVSSEEAPGVDRDRLTTLRTLHAPHGADIRAGDRIEADGLWDVDGHPADWTSPLTGWKPGITVSLTRTEVAG